MKARTRMNVRQVESLGTDWKRAVVLKDVCVVFYVGYMLFEQVFCVRLDFMFHKCRLLTVK